MENNTVPATGKRIALITGASSGMGREFVLALNRQEKFDELWLVAGAGSGWKHCRIRCARRCGQSRWISDCLPAWKD